MDIFSVFDYLLWLCLEGGRQHVGEEFQSYRKQELHEGDDDEHQEGKKSEDVSTCSEELGRKYGRTGIKTESFSSVCLEEIWRFIVPVLCLDCQQITCFLPTCGVWAPQYHSLPPGWSSYEPPAESSSKRKSQQAAMWKCLPHLPLSLGTITLLNPSYNSFNSQHFSPWAHTFPEQQKPPNSSVQHLHGAVDQSEHSASETAHLSQQEAHLFSTDLNNPQSIEAPGQHRSTLLYSCPTVAYWPASGTQSQSSHLQKRPWGEKAKTRVPLSTAFPPACQRKSRVKELGQPEWKGLCPQVHWHVYHLPELHIKGGRRGWQIKIEEALNGGLSIVSEYEKGRLRRQNQCRLDEWGCRWAQDMRSEGVSRIWKGADVLVERV